MRRLAALTLVCLLVSGCASSGEEDPATPAAADVGAGLGSALAPANNTTVAQVPATLELTGCQQMHTFFPFPVAMFGQLGFQLPSGFQYDSADGQTVDVLLAWWFCEEGRLNHTPNRPFPDVNSMFAAMPVKVPADLAASDTSPVPVQLDLVPLTWIVNVRLAADHLGLIEGLRNGYVEMGEVGINGHGNLGAAEQTTASAVASFGVFSVDAAVQLQPGDNPEGRYRMWLAPDGATVTGRLDIVNGPGEAVGSGYTTLRFNGDPDAGAPPATAGMAHAVGATDVLVEHVPLAAQA